MLYNFKIKNKIFHIIKNTLIKRFVPRVDFKLNFFVVLIFLSTVFVCAGQQKVYDYHISKAETLVFEKNYSRACEEYTQAFRALSWKGIAKDRYNAAIAWTISGNRDSAFYNLYRLAEKTEYLEYVKLNNEIDFSSLHNDKRWNELLKLVNPDNEIYNDSLSTLLSKIYEDDQYYRHTIDDVKSKYGRGSKEYDDVIKRMSHQDSLNLNIVEEILDKYGWLSKNVVGSKGNKALWLVIQHADLTFQEKYYPIMETAVKNKKASKTDLAYLQDRILMRQGKKQLYGTQYKIDSETQEMKLWEIEDPQNLNKRRESVGLPAMNID